MTIESLTIKDEEQKCSVILFILERLDAFSSYEHPTGILHFFVTGFFDGAATWSLLNISSSVVPLDRSRLRVVA